MTDTEPKLKVFVSYSRSDVAFADQLVLALEDNGFTALIDREEIHHGEEWEPRLRRMIIESDAVVFVETERAFKSSMCAWESKEAADLGKRILPVLPEPLPEGIEAPPELKARQAIPFHPKATIPGSGFYAGVKALISALSIDIEWVRALTKLTERATDWAASGQPEDRLPRGGDLAAAEETIAATPAGQHMPDIVAEFINAAAAAERQRDALAKAQVAEREAALSLAEARGRRLQWIGGGAIIGGVLLASMAAWLGWLGFTSTDDARALESDLLAERAAALSAWEIGRYEEALVLALEADPLADQRLRPGSENLAARTQIGGAGVNSRLVRTLMGHGSSVLSAVFSPDGTKIVTASWDMTARIWDLATGRSVPFIGHEGGVESAVFSPDGSKIVTASRDNTARIWDVETGRSVALIGHEDWVMSAVFSPDGTKIVTASADDTARVWDVATGDVLVPLRGHGDRVGSAVFSPDGTKIVTASWDMTARVWDTRTGIELYRFVGHLAVAVGVVFSSSRQQILTASSDGTARLWDIPDFLLLDTDDQVAVACQRVKDLSLVPEGEDLPLACQ